MNNKVGVVAIDDEASYLDAFTLTLSLTSTFEVVGRASDFDSGIATVLRTEPDLVVTDYRFPDGISGSHLAEALRDKAVTVPILILTDFMAPQVTREAGALIDVSVFSKSQPMSKVLSAMRSLTQTSQEIDLTDSSVAGQPTSSLKSDELVVLEQLASGNTPAEIANDLQLSLHTIRARIKSIHKKLDVSSQAEAVAVATRQGLVVPAH